MKRIIPIVFILVTALIVWFAFNRDKLEDKTVKELTGPKVVIPAITPTVAGASDITEVSPIVPEENQFISYIPLTPDETLIQSMTVDLDGDGIDDQISVVKRGSNPSFFLIVGMYNVAKGGYYRASEIQTEITQSKTFSFHLMDVVGDGVNCLVYSGITGKNETSMEVLRPVTHRDGTVTLKSIANIKSEGTIFIEELFRSDAYAIGLTRGASYPIWVYSFDPDAPGQSLDQIHTLYEWNPRSEHYEKISETKVAGKKIEAKEIARILDGKVETFENFLDGLWYKPSSGGNTQYLFFNPGEKEIIFLLNNTQEVYTWNSSILRRNGIYISGTNKSVTTQRRKFDITLSAIDEIKLKLSEDVQMKISADSSWDGAYRKMGRLAPTTPSSTVVTASHEAITKTLSQSPSEWVSAGNSALVFSKDRFTFSEKTAQESGIYALIKEDSETVIQFRSSEGTKKLDGYYKATIEQDQNKKTTLILSPVEMSIYGSSSRQGETFVFEPAPQTPKTSE